MEHVKLTKRTVDRLQSQPLEYAVHDTELAGFHVRVFPSGERTYAFRYKYHGRSRKLAIGSAAVMSAEEARTRAAKIKQQVRDGRDPSQERRDDLKAETMKELWTRYLRDHAIPHKKPRSVEEDGRLWKLHLERRFQRTLVRDLQRGEVQRMLSDMACTKGAANRSLALLSKMMNLAVQWGLAQSNPCSGVRKYSENAREPQPLGGNDTKALIDAIQAEAKEGDTGGALAIFLILLTGCRRGEALAARWSQFEEAQDGRIIWSLPASTTKQKKANRKPLGQLLSAELREWKAMQGGEAELLFPSPRRAGQTRADLKGVWDRIRERAGLTDVRIHDLRHDWITSAVSAGVPLEIAGKYAGHSNPATTRRYAHIQDDPLRQAADMREDALLGASSARTDA